MAGHLPADDEIEIRREENRTQRRDRKRTTRMVVDGAGLRHNPNVKRIRVGTHLDGTVVVDRQKPAKR